MRMRIGILSKRTTLKGFHMNPKKPKPEINLPTYGAGGTFPGIDINNSAELLDIMEADELAERCGSTDTKHRESPT